MAENKLDFSNKIVTASAFIFFFTIWSILSYAKLIDSVFLPSPTAVLKSLFQLLIENNFAKDIFDTTTRVLVGFIAASSFALIFGLLMANWKFFDKINRSFISFMRYLPVSGFIPLLILWSGIGFVQKVLVIFLGVFFHLTLLIADDSSRVPKEVTDTAKLLNVSKRKMIYKVLLPYSMPSIFDDMRIMLGAAWTYIIVAELVAATTGIGHMMITSQRFLLTERVVAGIITVGSIGVLSDIAFRFLGRLCMPWNFLSNE